MCNNCDAREMPKYKSHKVALVLKIGNIAFNRDSENALNRDGANIFAEEEGYGWFSVDAEYVKKHNPKIGGYYIVYKDGHISYSPDGKRCRRFGRSWKLWKR